MWGGSVGGTLASPLFAPLPRSFPLPAGGWGVRISAFFFKTRGAFWGQEPGVCPQGSHASWGLGLKGPGLTSFPICRQTMEYYCEACETAMCHECTVGEHREHVTVPLRDVVEQHKASLRQQLDAIKSRYCTGGLQVQLGGWGAVILLHNPDS